MQRGLPCLPMLVLGLTLISPLVLAEDAELGRDLYEEFCVRCHGKDLVNPGGVTFDLRKFPKDEFARFQNSVLNGKGQGMPPWRGKISDDDLKLLWAYVQESGK